MSVYMHKYMHVITFNEETVHRFERARKAVCEGL